MTYQRRKEIPPGSGRWYLYLQRSERDPETGKVRTVHVAYVGPENATTPATAAVVPKSETDDRTAYLTSEDGITFLHGTKPSEAKEIRDHGIDLGLTQRRDSGFFGKGFYVTRDPAHAKGYGTAIVKLRLKPGAKILRADQHGVDGYEPLAPPSWNADFIRWSRKRADAAGYTWKERDTDALTPGSKGFDYTEWRTTVGTYAKERGYAGVQHTEREIVIVNPDLIVIEKKR